ncbi:MAG: glutathione S-transferase family protein [Myxococcales bacterium]|nr:glutathione S-transferase family protein [Myxococcales bacterium]
MSLTFYYAPQSSASPVHWTLEELGIPYEKVAIDIRAGENKKPDFLKINPNGKVPVIVHNGVPIFESAAIQIYLGETFGVEKGLFPAPGPRRGEAMMWIIWTNVTLGDAVMRVGRNLSEWAPADERNAKAGERGKTDALELLAIVDTALTGRDYLLGDQFSIADLHLASWLEYVGMMGIDYSGLARLSAWAKRCTSRPACAKAP